MKRFNFRLNKLLDLRQAMERMQGQELGHADAAAEVRRQDLAASDSQLEAVRDQLGEAASAPQPAGAWHALGLSLDAARIRTELDAEELVKAEAAHAEELARYTEARSARRALEKLRDRREADWQVDAGRAEREESDELVRRRTPNQGGLE